MAEQVHSADEFTTQVIHPNDLLGQSNMLLVVPDVGESFGDSKLDFCGIPSRDFGLRGILRHLKAAVSNFT